LYQDTSEGFQTETGFFRRPDVRRYSQFASYRFRPEGKYLVWHGPGLFTINIGPQGHSPRLVRQRH